MRRSNLNVCRRLLILVKPLLWFMILAVVLGILGYLFAIFITVLGGYAILDLLNFNVSITLHLAFALIACFAVSRGLLHYGEQSCNHFIAFKLLALIRNQVFKALRRLCPAKLEGKDKGNLISIITSDIELLEVFYAHTISPIAIAFFTSGIMGLLIGSYHWLLGILAVIAYITVGVVIPLVTSKLGRNDGAQLRKKSGELSSFVLDSLRGISQIIQYDMGESRINQMEQRTDTLSDSEEKMKKKSGRSAALMNTSILLFDFGMLFLAGVIYQRGLIGFDGVLISVVALMSSFGPVMAIANLGSTLQNTFAAGNRVLDILDETPLVEELSGYSEVDFYGAQVEDITFFYDKEKILTDLSIAIPQNSIIGITGKSGSGKSTVLKLLMRFWHSQKGDIRISNRSINEINTANLRHLESYVTQETHLFNDSIRNNLLIAKLSATNEEIEEACKKASIHDFIIKLPQGYDTSVGELGDTLSGGERQRIGLARAFLHDAPFMLLDEPTSNLDSLNEAIILKSIDRQRKDKTIVLVSHRQSTMKIADKTVCVENGRTS